FDDDFARVRGSGRTAGYTSRREIIGAGVRIEVHLVAGEIGPQKTVVIGDLIRHARDPAIYVAIQAMSDKRHAARKTAARRTSKGAKRSPGQKGCERAAAASFHSMTDQNKQVLVAGRNKVTRKAEALERTFNCCEHRPRPVSIRPEISDRKA